MRDRPDAAAQLLGEVDLDRCGTSTTPICRRTPTCARPLLDAPEPAQHPVVAKVVRLTQVSVLDTDVLDKMVSAMLDELERPDDHR